MKIFLSYFKDYFKDNFSLKAHLLIGLFIVICIYANYQYEVYPKYFRVKNYSELGVIKLWGMFAFAFIVPLLIMAVFQKEKKTILNKHYLIFGLLGLFFVSLDSSYYTLKFVKQLIPYDIEGFSFYQSCLSNVNSLFTIMIPVFIVYYIVSYFKPELYGLKLNGVNIKPYLVLVAIMLPIVYISAVTQEDFTKYYPSYSFNRFQEANLSEVSKIALFEFCYGFDFISVELMFRGFMVVALSRFVGKDAILPMVACYAFLHFGKPMVETIGSVFGGFGLGILAYKSRNIYGGLIVHLAVAWGMELSAFILIS
jgi:hypothetical protein